MASETRNDFSRPPLVESAFTNYFYMHICFSIHIKNWTGSWLTSCLFIHYPCLRRDENEAHVARDRRATPPSIVKIIIIIIIIYTFV